jgi:hypothetical protein
MTRPTTGLRLVTAVVAALMLVSLGALPGVAQEGGDPPTESAGYVDVSCVEDAAAGTTTCSFTPAFTDGSLPSAITIAYGQLCATVVGAGTGVAGDAGYSFTGGGGALTLSGSVAVSVDTTTYTVEGAGGAVALAGPAIVCAAPPDTGPPTDPVTDPATPEPELPAATTVSVYALDCVTDPGPVAPGDLPTGCLAAEGLVVDASVDGVYSSSQTTDAAGWALFEAPVGSSLLLVEQSDTIATGYAPLGDGSATVAPVAEGASAVLIHVATDDGGEEPAPPPAPDAGEEEQDDGVGASDDPPVGRIQLVKSTCTRPGEPYTELRVIGQTATLQAQDESVEGCVATAGAEFLVTGGDLPVEGSVFVTGADGAYRGTLTPGSYTVTEVLSGESVEIEIVADETVLVVAIQYVEPVIGTIAIRRFVCIDSEVENEVTSIETFLDPPAEPDPGDVCAAEDGDYQLNDAEPFEDDDGDGAITFPLPIGTYTFNDLDTDTAVSIDILEGATTLVQVTRTVPGSDLSVAYTFCESATAYQGSPADLGYWPATCPGTTAGIEIRLLDAAGNIVGSALTDDDGVARWSNLAPGTYQIRGRGNRATCAVFIGGSAALGGFTVEANTIYQGAVYGCLKPPPDDGSGGNNTGGNNSGGNNSGGNNSGGNPDPQGSGGDGQNKGGSGSGDVYVTALPSTGSGSGQSSIFWPLAAAGLVVVGMGAEILRRRRAA